MAIRTAVVGLGFGQQFASMLNDHPDCQLVCVADLHRDRAAEVASRLHLERTAGSLDEVFRMRDVDAVGIFTHAPRHAEHSIAALRAGKHVLCAVPAAITIEQCEQLIETVRTTGLVYANAETSHFRPATAAARQWYRQGRFGRIVSMEAEYLHDHSTLEGITASPPEYGGKTWRDAGYPPFLYITHSTGHLLGVTGGRLVEVTAYPSAIPDDPVYRADTYWQCPFANAVGLFRTDDGVPVRIMEMRRIAYACVEKFSIYGQNLSFTAPLSGEWENNYRLFERDAEGRVSPARAWSEKRLYEALPDSLVKYTFGGHGGSHPYIVQDWLTAIRTGGAPQVNVYEAVAYCAPGIVAHQSCLRDGERMRIPQFGRLVRGQDGCCCHEA